MALRASKFSVRLRDEVVIDWSVGDQFVHDRVVERDIRAGSDLAIVCGEVGDVGPPHIHDHEFHPAVLDGLLEERGRDGVVRGWVTPGEQDQIGVFCVGEDVGDRAEPIPSSSAATEEAWQRRVQ